MPRLLILAVLAVATWAVAPSAFALNDGSDAIEIDAKEWFNTPGHKLADLKDKIVVLEFWATWCPPCRDTIPHLIELHEKYKDRGVVIISLTGEDKSEIKSFVDKMKMTYAIGTESSTSRSYGVRGIPHAYVISPGGKVFWHGHPSAGLDTSIEDALKKTPPILVKPEDKARGEKLLAEAESLLAQKQFASAIAKLKETTGIKGVFEAKATAVKKTEELEKQAASDLDALLKKPDLEAHTAAQEFVKQYEGTAAIAKAKTELERLAQTPDVRRAAIEGKFAKESAELLAQAHALYKQREFPKALALYERVAKDYPASEAGKEAAAKAGEIRADKALMAQIDKTQNTRAAAGLLRMAKSYIANHDNASAREKLEQLVKDYGDTAEATEGEKLLKTLK